MAAADVPASAPFKLKLRVGGTAVRLPEAEEPRSQRPRRARREIDYRQLEQLGTELQPGTDFAELLASKETRLLAAGPDIVRRVSGATITPAWLESDGFTTPLLVEDSTSVAGLRMPGPDFSVNDVRADVGGKRELDIIEVATQSELVPKWTLAEWAEYFAKPASHRARILNVISLEVSNTALRARLSSPAAVRAIDWIETVWSREAEGGASPAVQYYCLMSVAGSYTDFHIDFGGSSVWYHVVRGEKIFLLVPPTTDNLARFERWCSSPRQSFVFFGDQASHCYKLRIQQGQTFFIPSGWIHAVFTPVDSLVFGGNFVHSLAIEMQLDVAALETRTFVPSKFRFPYFERIHWYAAKKTAERFEAVARGLLPGRPLLPAERRGFSVLADHLKLWAETDDEVTGPPAGVQEPLRLVALLKQYTAANADISVALNAPPLLPLPAPMLKLRLSAPTRGAVNPASTEDVHSPSSAAASALAAVASLAAANSPLPVAANSPTEAAFKSEPKSESVLHTATVSVPSPSPPAAASSPAPVPAGSETPSGGRVVLKLRKPARPADEGVVLMTAPRKRQARKDEEDFVYTDDADWDEPEPEAEEEEEEEPYAPNGDGDADADADEPELRGHGKAAKAKAVPKASSTASPALAKKINKKVTTTARQRLQQKLGIHGTTARAFPQKR